MIKKVKWWPWIDPASQPGPYTNAILAHTQPAADRLVSSEYWMREERRPAGVTHRLCQVVDDLLFLRRETLHALLQHLDLKLYNSKTRKVEFLALRSNHGSQHDERHQEGGEEAPGENGGRGCCHLPVRFTQTSASVLGIRS